MAIISEILSEIHTMEKCDFLKSVIHSQIYSDSHSLFMTFRHKAFIKIIKFVRDYIFECLHYSQDSNMKSWEKNLIPSQIV